MQYVLFCIVVFLIGYVIYALTHNDGVCFAIQLSVLLVRFLMMVANIEKNCSIMI